MDKVFRIPVSVMRSLHSLCLSVLLCSNSNVSGLTRICGPHYKRAIASLQTESRCSEADSLFEAEKGLVRSALASVPMS